MTARKPLFVANGSTGVTPPQDARLAQAPMLTGPGVIAPGGSVTGSSSGPNMKYIVPAEAFATQRGTLAADGLYLWANDAPVTVDTLTPAPSSGTRWDRIWAMADNANDGFGDADSNTKLGFTVGTAGATPAKPTIPAGALLLAESLVGTSIANASLATITQVSATVVATGGLLPVASSTVRDALTKYKSMPVYRLDTGDLEIWNGTTWDVFHASGNNVLGRATRTTTSSAVSTESTITVNVAFTLATTRRVRWHFESWLTGAAGSTECRTTLRRNATGAAIANTDTRIQMGSVQGFGTMSRSGSELLTAGTYAYGLLIGTIGGGTASLVAGADFPTLLEVFDDGSS